MTAEILKEVTRNPDEFTEKLKKAAADSERIFSTKKTAAACLEGLTLNNGWHVKSCISPKENTSGGNFSHRYTVEKDGKTCFLKAFDFSDAFHDPDPIAVLQKWTSAYEHEREILQICRDRNLSKIVIALDHGNIQLPGTTSPDSRVFYLIFEMADGDIRAQVDATKRFGALWSIRAIRDICLGLWQIHRQMIAHQDLKPSNVLIFNKEEAFRLADFGRSSRKDRSVWYDEEKIPGDLNYAPVELLYGFTHTDFQARRFGCDYYMLGNLAAFMFGGINMSSNILINLDPQFHWCNWKGTYNEVLPYLQEAFSRVLEDLKSKIEPEIRSDVITLISQLCDPDLSRRGHPRGLGKHDQYSLERYVSHINLLCSRFEISQRVKWNK